MSNRNEAKQLLRQYLIARIPLIVVQTIEVPRALELIREVALELDREHWLDAQSFFAHTLSKGVYELCTNRSVEENAKSVLGAGDFLIGKMHQEQKEYQTLILTEVPDISEDNGEAQRLLDLVSLASEMYGTLVVLTHRPVWNTLQCHGLLVTLDMPDEEEMARLIHSQLDVNRDEVDIQWDEGDIREAAATLAGVTQIEAANVLSALLAKGSVTREDMAQVRSAKDRLFSNISGLEKIQVDPAMKEVGGAERSPGLAGGKENPAEAGKEGAHAPAPSPASPGNPAGGGTGLREVPVRQGHCRQLGTAPVPAGFRHSPGQLCGPVGTAAPGRPGYGGTGVPLCAVDRRNRKGPVRSRFLQ